MITNIGLVFMGLNQEQLVQVRMQLEQYGNVRHWPGENADLEVSTRGEGSAVLIAAALRGGQKVWWTESPDNCPI